MLSQSHDHPRDTNSGRQIVGGIGLCNFHPAIVEYGGVVAKHDDTHSAPPTSVDRCHIYIIFQFCDSRFGSEHFAYTIRFGDLTDDYGFYQIFTLILFLFSVSSHGRSGTNASWRNNCVTWLVMIFYDFIGLWFVSQVINHGSNSLTWLCANQHRHGRGRVRTGVEITRFSLRATAESKRNACTPCMPGLWSSTSLQQKKFKTTFRAKNRSSLHDIEHCFCERISPLGPFHCCRCGQTGRVSC